MAETLYGSLVSNGYMNTYPPVHAEGAFEAGRVRYMVDTVEASANAAVGSKYYLGKIPSNAVVIPAMSKASWDDLHAGAGSPTVSIGAKTSSGSGSDTALMAATSVTTAGTGTLGSTDIANYGKRVWELAGLSSDPGGKMDVYAIIAGNLIDTAGTITVAIGYSER